MRGPNNLERLRTNVFQGQSSPKAASTSVHEHENARETHNVDM